jgi:hypothetical protein
VEGTDLDTRRSGREACRTILGETRFVRQVEIGHLGVPRRLNRGSRAAPPIVGRRSQDRFGVRLEEIKSRVDDGIRTRDIQIHNLAP